MLSVFKGVRKGRGLGLTPLSSIFYKNFIIRECIGLDFAKIKGVRVEEYAYMSTNFAWKHEYDVKLWRNKKCTPNTNDHHMPLNETPLWKFSAYATLFLPICIVQTVCLYSVHLAGFFQRKMLGIRYGPDFSDSRDLMIIFSDSRGSDFQF